MRGARRLGVASFSSIAAGCGNDATGAPPPSVRLVLTDYTLFGGVAFWLVPAGLPLN